MLMIDVSDCHMVPSHALQPTDSTAVVEISPILLPNTVSSPEPVAARFARLRTLKIVLSIE
jgi:hypothetical protein